MNRMSTRNRDYRETHPEAQEWLYHFTLDMKKMFYKTSGENYQPFSMERLEEWHTHREDIESCGNFLSESFKSLHNPFSHEHGREIVAINAIVINLKLMLIGEKYELTEDMVQEADRAFMEITRCRKHRVVFYR
jgi:hypothetical protein